MTHISGMGKKFICLIMTELMWHFFKFFFIHLKTRKFLKIEILFNMIPPGDIGVRGALLPTEYVGALPA